MAQVSLDHHITETGAADPESVRVLSLARSTKIMGNGLGNYTRARAQELDLDSDPPQGAVRCNQGRRYERPSACGNVIHQFQDMGTPVPDHNEWSRSSLLVPVWLGFEAASGPSGQRLAFIEEVDVAIIQIIARSHDLELA
jgi:hypothetical protein